MTVPADGAGGAGGNNGGLFAKERTGGNRGKAQAASAPENKAEALGAGTGR